MNVYWIKQMCDFIMKLTAVMKIQLTISKATEFKVEEAKRYIQNKYNLNQLKQSEKQQHWKVFQEKVKELSISIEEKSAIKQTILHSEMQELRKRREKISKKHFQSICVIGRGAFGEVRLCREKKNNRMVAIKCLKKSEMIKKNQQEHLKAERNMLADGGEWIIDLLYSFQDQNYLYLVMPYLAGGDLMNLLIARNVLEEEQAKFYAAEVLLAIQSIHQKSCIHRDLKPDNILIDENGHIRLSDFGLCKFISADSEDHTSVKSGEQLFMMNSKIDQDYQTKKRNRKMALSAVGTPDYIAPEMLKKTGYTELVDWWAFGVMIYEMLIGYAPFSGDENEEIYYKIQNYEEFLHFPPQINISFEVVDLISKLLTNQNKRIGKNGVQEIKNHPWFNDIMWTKLREMQPPFEPDLTSQIDTKYFDKYQEIEPWLYQGEEKFKKDFNFIGYTYKIETQPSKNVMQEEIQKFKQKKDLECKQNERYRLNMFKKTKLTQQIGNSTMKINQLKLEDRSYLKSQIQTERSKGRPSKSPLQNRDMNKIKSGLSHSKSPLKRQKLIPTKKPVPNNLNILGVTQKISIHCNDSKKGVSTRIPIKKSK